MIYVNTTIWLKINVLYFFFVSFQSCAVVDKVWAISTMLLQSNNNICAHKNKWTKLSKSSTDASSSRDNSKRMKVKSATSYRWWLIRNWRTVHLQNYKITSSNSERKLISIPKASGQHLKQSTGFCNHQICDESRGLHRYCSKVWRSNFKNCAANSTPRVNTDISPK